MTADEVMDLARRGEGFHVEFKKMIPELPRLLREAVAFANAKGGYILMGVDDDGTLCGIKDPAEASESFKVGALRHCRPEIQFSIEQVWLTKKRAVTVIQIEESKHKPVRLFESPEDEKGIVYFRVEDKSIKASKELTQVLKHEKKGTPLKMEIGDKEKILLKLLEKYGRITVDEFALEAGISPSVASRTLTHLVKGNLLKILPGDEGDYFCEVAQ